MGKHLVMIKSNAASGKEAAFEDWYNNIHIGEVLEVPGFVTGQQFRCAADDPYSHFSMFEVESDDITATLTGLGEAFASGQMTLSDALDTQSAPETVMYQPTGEQQGS